MNCRRFENLMEDVLNDVHEVSGETRQAFEAHLQTCPGCAAEYEHSRQLTDLLQTYDELSPKTIDRLASQGEIVLDHPQPETEVEPVFNETELQASLARLMAKIDEYEQPGESPAADLTPMTLPQNVADLQRRVNTLEAWGAQRRSKGRIDSPATKMGRSTPGIWPYKLNKHIAAMLAVAACLALMTVAALSTYQGSWSVGNPAIEASNVLSERGLVELVLAGGRQSLPLGQPIASGERRQELLLSGMHRVVMNTDTLATIHPLDDSVDGYAVELARGELYIEVVPGHAFEVQTGQALLTITGTKFNVRTDPNRTDLALLKGSVRFAAGSNGAGEAVDVAAGFASSIVGPTAPTAPRAIDALASTAWARDLALENAVAKASPQHNGAETIDLNLKAWLSRQTLNLTSLDYATWRQEHRHWFASQFPWMADIERSLQQRQGVETDYITLLMISGDIWQFHYPTDLGRSIPRPYKDAVTRIASAYDVATDELMADANVSSWGFDQSDGGHSGSVFRSALARWRDDISQLSNESLSSDSLALFSMQATQYLTNTRIAAYLWLREHPDQAELLFADQAYREAFLHPLFANAVVDQKDLAKQMAVQLETLHQMGQNSRQWLMTPPADACLPESRTVRGKLYDGFAVLAVEEGSK